MKKLNSAKLLFILLFMLLFLSVSASANPLLLWKNLFIFTLLLSFVITIHELGHLVVAKMLKADPDEFNIGFGPLLFSKKFKDIDYNFRMIPLGGYVKIKKEVKFFKGMEDPKKESISPHRYFFIALAGPAANFLLFYFTFLILIFNLSFNTQKFQISASKEIYQVSFKENSEPRYFMLEKNNEISLLEKKPNELSKDISFNKASVSFYFTNQLAKKFFSTSMEGFTNLVSKKDYKSLSGPLGAFKESKKFSSIGFKGIFIFIAVLSFSVGFFNLLPFPAVDGGQALLSLIKMVLPDSWPKALGYIYVTGSYLFLLILISFSFLIDFLK